MIRCHDLVLIDLKQFLGWIDPLDQRNVGNLVPLVGQVHGKRRFRSPRNPDQHQIGLMQIAGFLAIIVLDREINRFNPLVVIGVDSVQQAGSFLGCNPQEAGQAVDQPAQQVHRKQPVFLGHPLDGLRPVAGSTRV